MTDTFHTYRCTGVCVDGSAHTTDLTGFEAERMADLWIAEAIKGERYVYVRISVLNGVGTVIDVRREWFISRKGDIVA